MKQQRTIKQDLAEIVTFVEFSLKADTLSPAQVTQSLGIIPSRVYAKGEQYASKAFDTETKRPVPRIGTHPWGLWAVETKDMVLSTNVEDHAIFLLNILEPKVEQIQAYLERSNEYSVRFYVEWITRGGEGGYDLSGTTLARMSRLCHYVQFAFLHTGRVKV